MTGVMVLGLVVPLVTQEVCLVFGFVVWTLVHLMPMNVAFLQHLLIIIPWFSKEG